MSQPAEARTEPVPATAKSGRSLLLTMVLVVAGALLAIYSLGQAWASSTYNDSITNQVESISGSALYPVAVVGAWISLASVLAVFATSGRARWVLGAVIVACGAAILVAPAAFLLTKDALRFSNALANSGAITTSASWILTGIGGLAVAAAGIVTIGKGASWRGLSARQTAGTTPARTPWEALDRGEDPTAS